MYLKVIIVQESKLTSIENHFHIVLEKMVK